MAINFSVFNFKVFGHSFEFENYISERYNVIDYFDFPFYVLAVLYFATAWWFKFKHLTIFQKECFAVAFLFVGFKWLNGKYLNLDFWPLIGICGFIISMPLWLWVERNFNWDLIKDKFKK